MLRTARKVSEIREKMPSSSYETLPILRVITLRDRPCDQCTVNNRKTRARSVLFMQTPISVIFAAAVDSVVYGLVFGPPAAAEQK